MSSDELSRDEQPQCAEGWASVVRYDDVAGVPWANGAGTTVELVSFEDSRDLASGVPRWRLSIASLDLPAAFSPLFGVRRRFMPVGSDVVLSIDGREEAVEAGAVASFGGSQDVVLTELGRPCHAVNLMVEGEMVEGQMVEGEMVEGQSELGLRWIAAGTPLPAGALLAVTLEANGSWGRFEVLRPPVRCGGASPVVLAIACAVIEEASPASVSATER